MKEFFQLIEWRIRKWTYSRQFSRCKQALGFQPDIRDTFETLEKIQTEHCSVSRYGDGELNLFREEGNGFCHYNRELVERLREVLEVEIPNHVVCLPRQFISFENEKLRAQLFWMKFYVKVVDVLKRYLRPERIYYDASFTRFYINYVGKRDCERVIREIRRIWEGRDVLVVEGEYSRLGVGNDLFGNVRSLRRVLAPAVDAFERYGEILVAAKRHGEGRLVLLALGQTATVLAYDLAKAGFWAIDIGHVDVEYEWYLRGAKDKIKIEGKYVQEAKDRQGDMAEIRDENYLKQIVCRV